MPIYNLYHLTMRELVGALSATDIPFRPSARSAVKYAAQLLLVVQISNAFSDIRSSTERVTQMVWTFSSTIPWGRDIVSIWITLCCVSGDIRVPCRMKKAGLKVLAMMKESKCTRSCWLVKSKSKLLTSGGRTFGTKLVTAKAFSNSIGISSMGGANWFTCVGSVAI